MPGTPLNLDLPSLSDTMSVVVAKTVAALNAVQNDLAPKITPAQITVNAPLSLLGNALTEVTSLQFSPGNTVITPGAVYYYNGEFYMVGANGTPVQITANGLVNIGGTGGFNGDYVASNPTGATYDLASGQFRFTKSAGVWADLSLGSVVHNNPTTGSVTIGADASLATGRIFNIKALPVAGISGLVYNGATSTVEDSAVSRETNTHLFSTINVSGASTMATINATAINSAGDINASASNVIASDFHHTAEWEVQIPYFPLAASGNIQLPNISTFIQHLKSTNVTWDWIGTPLQGLRVGDRLKRLTMKIVVHGTSTVNVTTWRATAGSLTLVAIDTWAVAPGAAGTFTHTYGTPLSVTAGQTYYFEVNGSASGEEISPMSLFIDHP